MKLFFAALVVMMPLAAADTTTAKPQAPARATTPPKATEIPQGAVETQAGTYTYTEPSGKKWIYRKTPFGIARMEDKGESAAATAPASKAPVERKVKAVEDGDTVHFERQGPFGMYRWDRKKSELNDAEREWLAGSRSNAPATARQE